MSGLLNESHETIEANTSCPNSIDKTINTGLKRPTSQWPLQNKANRVGNLSVTAL